MDGIQGVPYWLTATIALVSAIISGIVVHFFTRFWERTGRIHCYVDNWQCVMGNLRAGDWVCEPTETLAEASVVEFRFTLKAFNTKKIAVGLHRARVEFVERRWLRRRRILATENVNWLEYAGERRPFATYHELSLPSREWVTPFTEFCFGDARLRDYDERVRPLDFANCNAVYFTAETAEGSKKRWLIRKSL
jgi:hypothetical protein